MRSEIVAAALLGLVSVGGCSSQRSPTEAQEPAGAAEEAPTFSQPPPEAFPASPPATGELDELASLEAELGRHEAALWQAGVPVGAYAQRRETEKAEGAPADDASKLDARDRTDAAAPKPASRPARGASGATKKSKKGGKDGDGFAKNLEAGAEPDHCETVCELTGSICELEAKICDMADRHAGEPRYTAACERAAEDCRVASDACRQCSSG